MMTTAEGGLAYQRWLATINQVCGHFAARPLEESFHGEIDARYAGGLKVSTVTAAGVNLYRTRNEIKRDNDARFYTVFQLAGEAIIEQDDRRDAGGRRYHVNRRRPPMLHRLAADLASGLAAAAAPAGGAHRGHHYRLPAGQISANGPAQPATAAGKHGRHDALRQRERSRAGGDRLPVAPGAASARSCPFPAGKAVSEDYCVNRCVHSVGASASGVAGQRDGHVGTQPVPAVCRPWAGGGAVY